MSNKQWTALIVVLALLAGTVLALNRVGGRQHLGRPGVKVVPEPTFLTNGVVAQTNSVFLPAQIPGFASEVIGVAPLEVNWLPKDTTFGRRLYTSQDGQYSNLVSVVLMGTDRTSIHKPQFCLTSQGHSIDREETDHIPMARPHPYDLPVRKILTSFTARDINGQAVRLHGLYVYWFVADNELTASHIERMWWMARDLVRTGVLQRWAYVSCYTICFPGQEEATFERMKGFLAGAVPEFQTTSGKS